MHSDVQTGEESSVHLERNLKIKCGGTQFCHILKLRKIYGDRERD
jgi:hypothetical protein